MPLEVHEDESTSVELVPKEERVEKTQWRDGEVSFIHTSIEGQWIRIGNPEFLIDPEDSQ